MPTTTKNWKWTERAKAGRVCARGSIRTLKRGKALVRICCPKGKWSKKAQHCRVGTRAVAVAHRRKR